MATQKKEYLKSLLTIFGERKVVTSEVLASYGISTDLQKYYLRSGWVESVGRGAYKRPGSRVGLMDALATLGTESNVIHVGATSALAFQGYGHYINLGQPTMYLFTELKTRLPKWLIEHKWDFQLVHIPTSIFNNDLGVKELLFEGNKIWVSTPERAILECLLLVPKHISYVECYQLLEGMPSLRPDLLMELLTSVKSVKIKRIFMYLAERLNYPWFKSLKAEELNMGNGVRMLESEGTYVKKYQLYVPKELYEL